jgi:2-dehydro-3-deoxyphosphogluconate aldolase/(4S)-4-hydroxy-2-oxoglutarate aldolase
LHVSPKPPEANGSLAGARFILIARQADPELLLEMLHGLSETGLRHVEITLDSPSATKTIARLRQELPETSVGAGTIKTAAEVAVAAEAGAQFVVSPHGDEAILAAARQRDVPYVPGAYTPTEAMRAWSWGVPLVKLFPIASLGSTFLEQFRGPCPEVRLIVTGGVTLENAPEFRRAGASAVGMGSELLQLWRTG